MKSFALLGLVALAASACTTTYVSMPDPTPVIGAQLTGRSGECVDVQDGGTADGTPIVVFQCHGSPNERWYIKAGVISESYGSCIDVQGGMATEGAPLVLVSCTGTLSQQWSIVEGQVIGLGGKCLSETAGSPANSTPLVLATCQAGTGQIWTVL
jgi:hypothetical protein